MIIFNSASSPYMVLWYLFLVFFGLVLAMNLAAVMLRGVILWRTKRLMKKSGKRDDKK